MLCYTILYLFSAPSLILISILFVPRPFLEFAGLVGKGEGWMFGLDGDFGRGFRGDLVGCGDGWMVGLENVGRGEERRGDEGVGG
jgi:hypothetical protein